MGSDYCTHHVRAWLGLNDVPIFQTFFLECAVLSFAVRVETWVESSVIVFVNSATQVLLACVTVSIFTSTRVWFYCISVNSAALTCEDCTFDAYPLVFKVLNDLWVFLNDLAK